jgi:hypothetical protein
MLDNLSLSWKTIGCIAAAFFVFSAFRRKRRATGDKTVVLERSSLAGRAGGAIMAHAVLSVVSGIVGFNIIYTLLSIICSLVLMAGGNKVELAESVKAWPRSVVTRIREAFIDKKEAITEKIHDAKEAVVNKVTGKKDEPEQPEGDPDPYSDEFWGGPPNPNATKEMREEEQLAFDARPTAQKLAILEAARPIETALPVSFPDIYAPIQWYEVRIGRSASLLLSDLEITMYAMMWDADQTHSHGMDARTRAHFTRTSHPPTSFPSEQCRAGFDKLPAAERFAILNAAHKLMWPLPKQLEPPIGKSRDEQYYRARICPCWTRTYTRDDWKKARDAAFEEMQAAEIAAAEPKTARLMRAAREKAESVTRNLKTKATGRARQLAGDVKAKTSQAAHDLKDKAEEGVKEGAKGLFWKALGY